jgi:murein DD-endopeptidase MepM/ murein hydrolase activator NlpD
MTGWISNAKRRWFPDRQILLRQDGEVRYVALSSSRQLSVVAIALVGAVGLGVLFAVLSVQSVSLGLRDHEIAGLEAATAELSAALKDSAGRTAADGERLAAAEAKLTATRRRLDWYRFQAAVDIRRLEAALGATGIDFEALVPAAAGRAAARDQTASTAALGTDRVVPSEPFTAELAGGLGIPPQATPPASPVRWSGLRELVQSVPLAQPTDRGWVSSRYGRRRDPFKKRRVRHAGLDISAPRGTPIYATAPGRVTKAGWNGPYGRFVEIDHGFGFKTRYGHLKKLRVKRGQQVDYRHTIGTMGSSGRSSGTHLHYEIVYRGKTQDPAKFIEAGHYVFQERR